MADYEILYIVSGDKTEEEVTTVTDAVNNSLTKNGGKLDSENLWGRRRLAYPIAKQEHGWYVVTRFSLDGPKLNDWQNTLRIQPGVVRTLIVRADEVPTEEEAQRAEEAVSGAEKAARQKQAKPPRTPSESEVPEELAKTAKPAAPKPVEPEPEPEPKKPETAEEQQERQAELDKKLDEILQDSE